MEILAVIGAQALYLLFGWLASAVLASLFSGQKGYGERAGLASGLILAPLGVIVWVLWPAKRQSDWRVIGPTKAAFAALVALLVIGIAVLAYGVYKLTDDGGGGAILLLVVGLLLAASAGIALATSKRGGTQEQAEHDPPADPASRPPLGDPAAGREPAGGAGPTGTAG